MAGMGQENVLTGLIKPGVVRFVTHRDVDDAAVSQAMTAAMVPEGGNRGIGSRVT